MIRRFGLFGATMLALLMPFLYVMIFTTLLIETKSARQALRMTWGADIGGGDSKNNRVMAKGE